MEERRLTRREHRRKALPARAGEHRLQPIGALVQAGAQGGDQRLAVGNERELLGFVEQQQGGLARPTRPFEQIVQVQEGVVRRLLGRGHGGEIDFRLGAGDGETDLRRDTTQSAPTPLAERGIERVQQHRGRGEGRLPKRCVDHAMTARFGGHRQVFEQELGFAGAPRAEQRQRLPRAGGEQVKYAGGEIPAGEMPWIRSH